MGEKIERLAALSAGADPGDVDLILELAGRLDWSPKKNWVEEEGGLPKPIEDMALALIRDEGFTRERAIATSINRAEQLAAKGNPKYVAAITQWTKMKAARAAKKAAK